MTLKIATFVKNGPKKAIWPPCLYEHFFSFKTDFNWKLKINQNIKNFVVSFDEVHLPNSNAC